MYVIWFKTTINTLRLILVYYIKKNILHTNKNTTKPLKIVEHQNTKNVVKPNKV